MKKTILILSILFSVTALTSSLLAGEVASQSFEVFEGDTINQVDIDGKKQGFWKIWYTKGGQLKEEGKYKSSRKNGLWKKYYPEGEMWSQITYKNNRPAGDFTTYYQNGVIEEKGSFYTSGRGKYTGDFVRYHENGNISQEKKFNESGKTNGVQKLYHENGQVAVEWSSTNGMEVGELTRYYENGDVEEKKMYDAAGVITSSKSFEMKDTPAPIVEEVVEVKPKRKAPFGGAGIGSGNKTLYNSNLQIYMKGEFANGKLKNGRVYLYSIDGLLEKIEIFKNFEYRGDAVIEEE